jgi:hypothetical protein
MQHVNCKGGFSVANKEVYAKMSAAFVAVIDGLRHESDRGCAILAFAWMDDQLTANLQKFLLPQTGSPTKSDELLSPGRPIGDASTKIDISWRLGLLRSNTRKSLHMFRKLRNDFAHMSTNLTFETSNVHDRVLAIFDNESLILDAMWKSVSETPDIQRMFPQANVEAKGADEMRKILGSRHLFG